MYDYIIIDTPPIGSVIDSAIVAQECDGVAYVMAANDVSYKYAQKGLEQIKRQTASFLEWYLIRSIWTITNTMVSIMANTMASMENMPINRWLVMS